VWRYISTEPSRTLEETGVRLDLLTAIERRHGFTLWAVVERETGVLVGDCGLIPLQRLGPEIELGYRLGKPHWGKGYATEAASAARDLGFGRFRLEQILVDVNHDNEASQNVARKIGARLLGDAKRGDDPVLRFVLER
jgi:ribosomal-protein-alanine N-acetyltransferase